MPRPESWRAKSTRPVLSVTLRIARWMREVGDNVGLLGSLRSERKFYQEAAAGRLVVLIAVLPVFTSVKLNDVPIVLQAVHWWDFAGHSVEPPGFMAPSRGRKRI